VEWVGFYYALFVFCSSESVGCFYVFVELCVGLGCVFCCFWVDVVEEAFFEDVRYVFAFDGFDGLHFSVEYVHGVS